MVLCTQKAVSWEGKEVFYGACFFFLDVILAVMLALLHFPYTTRLLPSWIVNSLVWTSVVPIPDFCMCVRVCVFEAILGYIWNSIKKKDINKTKTKQQRSRTKLITITETAQYIRISYKVIPNVFIIDLPSAILFTIEKTTLS